MKYVDEKKETNKIMLFRQEQYPKDILRRTLQRIYGETCRLVLKDILGVGKEMVACHAPKILTYVVTLIKTQASKDHKIKYCTCATKKGKEVELAVEIVTDIVAEDIVT